LISFILTLLRLPPGLACPGYAMLMPRLNSRYLSMSWLWFKSVRNGSCKDSRHVQCDVGRGGAWRGGLVSLYALVSSSNKSLRGLRMERARAACPAPTLPIKTARLALDDPTVRASRAPTSAACSLMPSSLEN